MQIVEKNAHDAELKYQCECGTWLKSEYSYCEKCEKKERKEWYFAWFIVVFSLAVVVGLVLQFKSEIANFLQFIVDWIIVSPPFIQGFVCTFLFGFFVYFSILLFLFNIYDEW